MDFHKFPGCFTNFTIFLSIFARFFFQFQSRTVESSRNSRSMENLDRPDHHQSSAPVEASSRGGASSSSQKARRREKEAAEAERRSKKENRKSTPSMPTTSSGNHGSPSRVPTSSDKSGSGGKRRDHPSGVGAIGGRGSILHNTVNPLLSEVRISTVSCSACTFVFVSQRFPF
jgi:hypothetical protein